MKHEIEIPGLPDGYRLVSVNIKQNDRYRNDDGTSTIAGCDLVIERIKTRTIKIEETGEFRTPNKGEFYSYLNGPIEQCDVDDAGDTVRIYRVVGEE